MNEIVKKSWAIMTVQTVGLSESQMTIANSSLTLHEITWVTAHCLEFDVVSFDPFAVLGVRSDLASVSFSHKTFAQRDVRLYISSRSDCQACELE